MAAKAAATPQMAASESTMIRREVVHMARGGPSSRVAMSSTEGGAEDGAEKGAEACVKAVSSDGCRRNSRSGSTGCAIFSNLAVASGGFLSNKMDETSDWTSSLGGSGSNEAAATVTGAWGLG